MEEKNKEFTLAQEHAAPPPECAALPPEVLPPEALAVIRKHRLYGSL